MADLVFSAAAAIATSATDGNSNGDANQQQHEFGVIPYERVLTIAECKKLENVAHKLHHLDPFVHVWVRDARSFRHGKDSDM